MDGHGKPLRRHFLQGRCSPERCPLVIVGKIFPERDPPEPFAQAAGPGFKAALGGHFTGGSGGLIRHGLDHGQAVHAVHAHFFVAERPGKQVIPPCLRAKVKAERKHQVLYGAAVFCAAGNAGAEPMASAFEEGQQQLRIQGARQVAVLMAEKWRGAAQAVQQKRADYSKGQRFGGKGNGLAVRPQVCFCGAQAVGHGPLFPARTQDAQAHIFVELIADGGVIWKIRRAGNGLPSAGNTLCNVPEGMLPLIGQGIENMEMQRNVVGGKAFVLKGLVKRVLRYDAAVCRNEMDFAGFRCAELHDAAQPVFRPPALVIVLAGAAARKIASGPEAKNIEIPEILPYRLKILYQPTVFHWRSLLCEILPYRGSRRLFL